MAFIPLLKPTAISDQDWPPGTTPLLSIWCAAYNHEVYLIEAVESFLMQETTFPVQIILHDDASTDGTPEIIQRYAIQYPKIVTAILQPKNLLGSGTVPNLQSIFLERTSSEFIAYCDGDDFWTDTSKLQTQLAIMMKDPNVMLTFHRVCVKASGSYIGTMTCYPEKLIPEPQTEDLLELNFIPTCSVVVRNATHFSNPSIDSGAIKIGDWPRWIIASLAGKLVGLPDSMACYRQHSGGIWSSALPPEKRWGLYQFWWAILDIMPRRFKPKVFHNILSAISKGVRSNDPQFSFPKRVIYLFKLGIQVSTTDPQLMKALANDFVKTFLGPSLTRRFLEGILMIKNKLGVI